MWIGGNFYLTIEEMKINATYIWNYLKQYGWSLNSVCGMLGNMQTESTINPSIWQNLDEYNPRLGYGLVQWTPATKYFDWCNEINVSPPQMDSNLKRINYEVENNLQWIPTQSYPISFQNFKTSILSPYELGIAFLLNYERPADQNQPIRGAQAEFWWYYLSDVDPPNPTPKNKKGMPIYFYLRRN